MTMMTEDEIRDRINELRKLIDHELDTPAQDPVRQWALIKTYHAMKIAFEEVLS